MTDKGTAAVLAQDRVHVSQKHIMFFSRFWSFLFLCFACFLFVFPFLIAPPKRNKEQAAPPKRRKQHHTHRRRRGKHHHLKEKRGKATRAQRRERRSILWVVLPFPSSLECVVSHSSSLLDGASFPPRSKRFDPNMCLAHFSEPCLISPT